MIVNVLSFLGVVGREVCCRKVVLLREFAKHSMYRDKNVVDIDSINRYS